MPRQGAADVGDRPAGAGGAEGDGDLSRLMDVEQRLGRELDAAEAQAARTVQAARDAAEVRLRVLEAELEAEATRLAVAIEAERDRTLARLADDHQRQAAAYAAAQAAHVQELAGWVVEELLRRLGAVGEPATGGSGEGTS